MSNLEILVSAGAVSVCGALMLDGVEMGQQRNGDLLLSSAGTARLQELAASGAAKAGKPTKNKKPVADKEAPTPAEPSVLVDAAVGTLDELDADLKALGLDA